MDESTLRQMARDALRAGKIPSRPPERMWGGPGSGACCAVCGLLVSREELGFEFEFARNGHGGPGGNFHAHIRCFAAWELERDQEELDVTHRARLGPRPPGIDGMPESG
jgi:hypothetical protein